MIVLIPCKSLEAGKSRLSACLDTPRRRRLCEYFLLRTVELAIALVGADRVRVLTSDPQAIAVAASYSIPTLADKGSGLNAAIESARDQLRGDSHGRLMILPIDLPHATLDALGAAAETQADVVINSDESGRGTNLLILSGATGRLPFSFGASSFAAHSNAARAAGLTLHVMKDPRLTCDIDEPTQYLAWTKSASFPHHLLAAERAKPLAGSTAPI